MAIYKLNELREFELELSKVGSEQLRIKFYNNNSDGFIKQAIDHYVESVLNNGTKALNELKIDLLPKSDYIRSSSI